MAFFCKSRILLLLLAEDPPHTAIPCLRWDSTSALYVVFAASRSLIHLRYVFKGKAWHCTTEALIVCYDPIHDLTVVVDNRLTSQKYWADSLFLSHLLKIIKTNIFLFLQHFSIEYLPRSLSLLEQLKLQSHSFSFKPNLQRSNCFNLFIILTLIVLM